ncbi:MAG: permease-like cell division protein FtsX [Lachnospiraceae bacterium]|nr:permease-like cell division protein FtsX [Lachnospiraceae bacterium]
MKINTFFYTLGQGIKSIFRNKWFTLASLATISACLFVFGLFFAVAFNVENIVKTAEEGVSVTVFFDEGISQDRIDQIGDLISRRTEVSRYEFISADQAWEEFSKELGENAEGFTENPLANSANYQIYLKDVSKQSQLVSYLEEVEGVRKVNKSELTANTLAGVNVILAYVSIGMIIILLAVSIFLISNTVTIGISVRKEEITIMKYIGATDFFVRSPFVFEGMIIGFIGSLIPLAMIFYLYKFALNFLADKFAFLSGIVVCLPAVEVFKYLAPISIIIGVGIGFCGSFFTVKKHLKV